MLDDEYRVDEKGGLIPFGSQQLPPLSNPGVALQLARQLAHRGFSN